MTQDVKDPAMSDLETLGTSPNSIILSIGAVKFDEASGTIHSPFYVVVNTASCIAVGMYEDPDTRKWWEDKPEAAKKVLREAETSPVTIQQALQMFNDYLHEDSRVWGNGADFDNSMLQEAYRKCGLEPKWKFWNNRCYRTMKNMFPVSHRRAGVHHNALDDATYQAEHLLKILAKMRG